jgi:hypothetical protein
LRDVPERVDEFFRLRFFKFSSRTKRFWIFKNLIEDVYSFERFVSFTEYQELFKDKGGEDLTKIRNRYPAFKLMEINNERQKSKANNNYANSLSGYFTLMKSRNKKLRKIYNETHKVRLPEASRESHTYIVGGTKSGKSELLKHLILQDILRGDKCVILIEPNGDLAEQVARQKDLDPERLVYIDCSLSPHTPHINPFEMISTDEGLEIEKQSQIIRIALQQICQSDGQPITLQMQSILQPCLEIVARLRGTLKDVQRFMVSSRNKDLKDIGLLLPKHSEFFEHTFDGGNLSISKNGIFQKLMNVLNLSAFRNLFCGKTTVDLKKAIEEKKIIVFNLSKGKLGAIASEHIGKMLIAILQNIIFQRAVLKEDQRVPMNIYVDEFQDFINDSIEEIFVQGRKYKVSLTVACQVVGQKMTAEMTRVVLGNTSCKFIGRNGYESLRIMSKETFTEIDELRDLETGQFFSVIDKRNGFILEVGTDYLKDKTCMNDEERAKVLQQQIKKHYQVRPQWDEIEIQEPIATNRIPPKQFRSERVKTTPFNPKY